MKFTKEQVMGVVRHALTFLGGVVVAKGFADEFSMLTKMGKTCAKHMGVTYITDVNQVDKFREEYLKKVEEIGEMEFWVPNSQIKSWEGNTQVLQKMSHLWFK